MMLRVRRSGLLPWSIPTAEMIRFLFDTNDLAEIQKIFAYRGKRVIHKLGYQITLLKG